MDRDRRLSYLILKDIEEKKSWSNLTIGKFITKEGANSPAFVREIVYGVLRNQLLLDYNINRYLKKPKLGLPERIWLRMGFYQLSFMSGVSEYAAVNETVELARNFKRGSEKFINAVLRSFQRDNCELIYPSEQDKSEYLSIKYSCNEQIVEILSDAYGFEKADELLGASNTVAPLCIRVNRLKTNVEDLIKRLSDKGFETQKSDLAEYAAFVKGSGLIDTDEFKNGLFSVQGLSSQIAVQTLNPRPGDTVIDLCSAPGGKTCAMAEMMQDNGSIFAFDLYEHRIGLVESEAKRLGHKIIKASVQDASKRISDFEKKADCVLADAPCSGLGTLRENPEIKLKDGIDKELPSLQLQILENAAAYVKDGGKLLYSTCTMNPLENEKVVESFLENTKGFEVERKTQLFTKENGEDGFFICLLRRI